MTNYRVLFLTLLIAAACCADDVAIEKTVAKDAKVAYDAEVTKATQEYERSVELAAKKRDAAVAQAQRGYLLQLKRAIEAETKQGHLDRALAVRAEIERIEKGDERESTTAAPSPTPSQAVKPVVDETQQQPPKLVGGTYPVEWSNGVTWKFLIKGDKMLWGTGAAQKWYDLQVVKGRVIRVDLPEGPIEWAEDKQGNLHVRYDAASGLHEGKVSAANRPKGD
ncbi:MAG: hypothetical protein GC159_08065 [Phycisphaera sp.]|nr:hypothetical protein [Phycisphaera sp.]